MQMKEAARLRKAWGQKPCDHPRIEKEYYLGSHTGDEVCAQCGREILRDRNGKPLPSRGGAA